VKRGTGEVRSLGGRDACFQKFREGGGGVGKKSIFIHEGGGGKREGGSDLSYPVSGKEERIGHGIKKGSLSWGEKSGSGAKNLPRERGGEGNSNRKEGKGKNPEKKGGDIKLPEKGKGGGGFFFL